MTKDEHKLEILRKVENGTLSIEEGSNLIEKLDRPEESHDKESPLSEEPVGKHAVSGCWKAAWSMFLVGGAILTGFSAYWVYQGYAHNGFGWGFWLSWIPMLIGIALMIFGWMLLESPWMQVSVRTTAGHGNRLFVFNMPVPINLAKWGMQVFGQYIEDHEKAESILDVLEQAEAAIKNGETFRVQVDDDKDHTKVDISIN